MPKCINDPSKTYKGVEPSPKGLGYCAHAEKEDKIMKGKDNNNWIVKSVKNGNKRWVKINKLELGNNDIIKSIVKNPKKNIVKDNTITISKDNGNNFIYHSLNTKKELGNQNRWYDLYFELNKDNITINDKKNILEVYIDDWYMEDAFISQEVYVDIYFTKEAWGKFKVFLS